MSMKSKTIDRAIWFDKPCTQRIQFMKVGNLQAAGGSSNTDFSVYLIVSGTDDLRGAELID